MKIVHLTDTHLCDPGESLFEVDPGERLRCCIDDINRHHGDAALCVLTGDLAHRGSLPAYVRLREELGRLRVPHRLLLGNHDDRTRFKACFPEAPTDGNGFVQSHVDLDGARMVLLDTLQPGTHAGWLCEARLSWLESAIAGAGERAVFIAMHHPPFAVGHPALDRMALVQAEAFKAIVLQSSRVRHIFFGHVHRPISGSWCDRTFSALNGTTGLSRLHFEEEDMPPRNLPPPAFSTALIRGDGIIVHTHVVNDPSPRFVYDDEENGQERKLVRLR